jgi:hypothetical protein
MSKILTLAAQILSSTRFPRQQRAMYNCNSTHCTILSIFLTLDYYSALKFPQELTHEKPINFLGFQSIT